MSHLRQTKPPRWTDACDNAHLRKSTRTYEKDGHRHSSLEWRDRNRKGVMRKEIFGKYLVFEPFLI